MKIVVLDGYALNPGDLSWSELEQAGQLTVYDRTAPEDVVPRADGADIILTNKTVITAGHIGQLHELKYIGVLATGYNVVDTAAARNRGIPVCNIPAYSTASVAQMAFALLLTITNRVEHYTEQNREGRWNRNPDFCYWDTPLMELSGKRMGIVGLGHTGMATARIAQAFGMEVCALTSKSQEHLEPDLHKIDRDTLLRTCDVISLHCPLTPDTHEFINRNTLALMKPTAILINTGRGPLVNEQDVADALNEGRIAAYGADVLSVEPALAGNPLLTARNAFLTPHIAWATREARERLMRICAENIRSFQNGTPQNVVN